MMIKAKLPLLDRLTFRSKLIVLALLASISSIAVIAALGLQAMRQGVYEATLDELTTLQFDKAHQVQDYFQLLKNHAATLSESRMVVTAMVEFNKDFRRLDRKFIPSEWDEFLQTHYETDYFPKLVGLADGEPRFGSYRPSSQGARYLQHHYLVLNPHDPELHNNLVTAKDDSDYSRYHEEYHPLFNRIVQQFGYADLYLINYKTGDIVYSVSKDVDFGTNLETGPYRQSSLAELTEIIRENSARGTVAIADFQRYEPGYGKQSLFIASPVYNGPYIVGILAIRVGTAPINQTMAHINSADSSLDSYLVGADGLLRSDSRFFQNDPERYLQTIRRSGVSEETLNVMERLESSVALQPVETAASEAAVGGESGARRQQDYRDVPALTAYAPIDVEGLNWAILSQIDVAEASAPIIRLRLAILVASIVLVVLFTFLALVAGALTIEPVRRLREWTDQVVDGDLDAELDVESEDEIGQLADTLQIMVTGLSQQVINLNQKMEQNEVLLTNLVPHTISKRIRRGEPIIADQVKQMTILHARIVGVAELSRMLPVEQVTELLTRLMQEFDSAADQYGIERQHTPDVDFIATCGLTTAHLDHTKRMVDFALEILQIVRRPEFAGEFNLGLRLAVHSGPALAGVIGTKRFNFNIWGEAVYVAARLHALAPMNQVVLTQAAYERIADAFTCMPIGSITIDNIGDVDIWTLATRDKMAMRQVDLVQHSFNKAAPHAERVGELFYQRLFQIRPDFRSLFTSDMAVQQRKLMQTLAIAVEGLRNPEKIIPVAQDLGRRHSEYGVDAEYYTDVGAALLWTLEQGLGDDFTPEVRRAWETAYGFLSSIMINAAAQVEPENIGV